METEITSVYSQAVELFERKDYSSAQELLLKLVSENPYDIDALHLLGKIHLDLGEISGAIEYFEKTISIYDSHPSAHYNLGLCYQSLNNEELARKHFERALINIGFNFRRAGNDEEAEKYFDKISSDKKSKAILFTNIGVEKMGRGFVKEAIEYFELALQYSDEYPEIHYNNSHALLITGNLGEGWKEYEWRKKRKEYYPREYSKPELKPGMPVKGKKILVFDEQGLGDSIQFIRYILKLKEEGAEIILECNKKLHRIFKTIAGNSYMIERRIDKEPQVEFDYQIPLLSLPFYFGTNLNNIPSIGQYIFAERELTKKMSALIGTENDFKIGIVWGGNPSHTSDDKRSIPLSHFSRLLSVENVKLLALQKGSPLKQIEEINFLVYVLDKYLNDFADTAAAIENLDLVITIDTSVAHLAGAMGKPVWLLLPFFPDWRWLLNRNDSPWYPTMKIFRQKEEGDWTTVFDEVVREMHSIVKSKGYLTCRNNYAVGSKEYREECNGKVIVKAQNEKLYLGLSGKQDYGWGIVNRYLKKEVASRIAIHSLEEKGIPPAEELKDAKIFQILKDLSFNPIFDVAGRSNFGYTVFENELNDQSVANSLRYDLVIAASTWGKNKLLESGIKNAGCLIQGVDTEKFYPGINKRNDNLFVIFSGGKFELRKGQDLVLKAISILQKKYKDIILITAWYNLWLESARLMAVSKHIKYEERGNTWEDFMKNIYLINGIDPGRVFTMPLIPNNKLRELYLKSDIGLFPNRCEGGTNLVMMEYMACGKPVIASYNTGHKDIIDARNSIPLMKMKKFELIDQDKKLVADWEEPDVEEIIFQIEFAYHQRDELKLIGTEAAKSMRNFTWANTAENLLRITGFISDENKIAVNNNAAETLSRNVKELPPLEGCIFEEEKFSETCRQIQKPESYFQLKPEDYSARAINLKKSGNTAEAEKNYLKAIELNPEFWQAYYNLGILYHETGKFKLAVDCYKKSIQLKSDFYLSHYNLGSAYRELFSFDLACGCYEKSIQLKPDYPDAHYNLGVVRGLLNNFDEALECYNRAIYYDAEHVNAHWNRSLLLLLSGNLIEGFKEYEWRMKRKEFSKRNFVCPPLTDQNIANKRIVVYTEQGLGDAIQFVRYLPMLKRKGCKITVACDPLLLDLFKLLDGIENVISEDEALKNQGEYDFNISLLSLPYYFRTTLETVPANVPYIKIADSKKEEWKDILGKDESFKIGLVWGGNPKYGNDDERSIPLNKFSPLSSFNDIKFFSLQKGKPLEQISNAGFKIENLSIKGQDTFNDTAAIILNLDLVISVDTSVAHLAGALGKPVWTLLPYHPDWRWMRERADSPWYPTMRLFRQKTPGNWKEVIIRAGEELNKVLVEKSLLLDAR